MKHLLALLALGTLLAAPSGWAADAPAADENGPSAVASLCKTYAEDDKVASGKTDAYVKDCVASMTDLGDSTQAAAPEDSTPTAAKASSNPEQLVKDEIVETPDPTAEQLITVSKL